MQETRQSSGEREAVAAPPEPILGLDADPAQERHFMAISRTALGFAIAAFLIALLYLGSALFGFRVGFTGLLIAGVCWMIGLALGLYARRTRPGKAAILLSLLLPVLGILGV